MSLTVQHTRGGLVVSADIAAEADIWRNVEREMTFGFAAHWHELELDMEYGRDTRHHPNRSDLHAIQRPDRIRANIRRNLEWAGLSNARFGQIVRPS